MATIEEVGLCLMENDTNNNLSGGKDFGLIADIKSAKPVLEVKYRPSLNSVHPFKPEEV